MIGSGEGKINWVALGDVLQFAVRALDHPAAHNATLELNGPDWLSQMDVIRLCEEIAGRPFAIQHVPEETLQEQANTATDEYGQTFAILMLCITRGQSHAVDRQETLQAFPVHLTSVRDYVRTALSR